MGGINLFSLPESNRIAQVIAHEMMRISLEFNLVEWLASFSAAESQKAELMLACIGEPISIKFTRGRAQRIADISESLMISSAVGFLHFKKSPSFRDKILPQNGKYGNKNLKI
jgi:hypothetical protein